ncbi:MAG: hypothetical protein ACT4PJ_15945 [Gemmatimonadaceae bacterium]
MRPIVVERAALSPESIGGLVLCQDVRGEGGRPAFAKGRILQADDAPLLMALPWERLHVAAMEAGEIHEDAAGRRIAVAAAGDHVTIGSFGGGHWPLTSMARGILDVSADALRHVNSLEGPCVYSAFHGQVVDLGEVVARAKITPFALPETRVREAERIGAEPGGMIRVRPFHPMRIGAVVQETLGERAMTRFKDALSEKVEWLGSALEEPRFVAADPERIGDAITGAIDDGAEVIALAGTKAMDLLDPAFVALERIGATIERHGVPAHPGSLFWLALRDDVPILGMPTCGLFSQATVFDLILPRILTGERIGSAKLAELGHGGLLTRDMSFRFPPYRRSSNRGEVE